jgi:cytoskeletal protein RodZ
VTIGDALADARRQAGLTITQVSQRTCIRETIIRGIEQGDYSACGGDFYARGHIRSIARAVGLEPDDLVREYDVTQAAPQPITAADVFQPFTPVKLKERRRPNWTLVMLGALAVIVGIGAFHYLSKKPAHDNGADSRPPVTHHHHQAKTVQTKKQQPPAHNYRHKVVITLHTVSNDCWVQITTANGKLIFDRVVPVGTWKTWTEKRMVTMTLGDPIAVTLTVDGRRLATTAAQTGVPLSFGPRHRLKL